MYFGVNYRFKLICETGVLFSFSVYVAHQIKGYCRSNHFYSATDTSQDRQVCKVAIFHKASQLTCGGPDGGGNCGWCHGGDTLVVLRESRLDGSQITVAACPEAARQVQSIHGLRLHLAEYRFTHWFKLPVHLCLTHLQTRTTTQKHVN